MKPNKQYQLIQAMLIFNPKLTVGECARCLSMMNKYAEMRNVK